MTTLQAIQKATRVLLDDPRARSAAVLLTPRDVVTVSRRTYRRRPRASLTATRHEFAVTCGRPNVELRDYVRDCVKVGEPFPVRKLKIRYYAWA